MTRRALGRGLSALLGEVETTTVGLEQVLLSLIDPNPSQPRRAFPEEGLRELADSIRASGVVQPIMVRRANGRYQLVVGEPRWRGAPPFGPGKNTPRVPGLRPKEEHQHRPPGKPPL